MDAILVLRCVGVRRCLGADVGLVGCKGGDGADEGGGGCVHLVLEVRVLMLLLLVILSGFGIPGGLDCECHKTFLPGETSTGTAGRETTRISILTAG